MSSRDYTSDSQIRYWHRGVGQTFAEATRLAAQWSEELGGQARIAVRTADPLLLNAVIRVAARAETFLVACPQHLPDAELDVLAGELSLESVITGTAADHVHRRYPSRGARDERGIAVFTSGTTGRPKVAIHDWTRIQKPAQAVPRQLHGRRWLMAYTPVSYAGLQVFFAASNSEGSIYYCPDLTTETCEVISQHGIEVISATPTYWRLLVGLWPPSLSRPRIIQATLGGEAVRQDTIDLVRSFFDPERITHIYASTEAGSAIVTSDGREGFSRELLERTSPPRLRIRDGFLEIQSDTAMLGYVGSRSNVSPEGWIRTPDKVIEKDGRVIFAGREDGVINVGGMKVGPEEIELAINSLPGVVDSIVYARSNVITGSLLAADVVRAPGGTVTSADVTAALGRVLPAFKIPRLIRFVNSIPTSPNGKKIRL